MDPTPPPAAAAPCWSDVLRKAAPKPEEPISSRVFGDLQSSKGVAVAVVDANAVIHGDKLSGTADKFVTVSEVLDEVRDPVSRQRMAYFPIQVETLEPSAEAVRKVVKFARETGDLQTLSDVDLKVIALAYMLESQIHGTSHLRESPPPLRMVSVKNLPEQDMPGWGKNVRNLEEWEALEHLAEDTSNNNTRILPLRDLSSNVDLSSNGTIDGMEQQDSRDHFLPRPRRYSHPKKPVKTEGKMVIDGIDASRGECNEDNSDDWRPAVGRSTHRRYLRRKARQLSEASEKDSEQDLEVSTNASNVETADVLSDAASDRQESVACEKFEEAQHDESPHISMDHVEASANNEDISVEGDEIDICAEELDQLDIASQADGSEQSWALKSLSESTVACVTSDFAMQNVILQIGLRLLVPGGMQIRQLHRWVLKCHACNKVTAEIGRLFCPKCGNGGTLRKVSVTVNENGIILASRRPRINLRGTKFSLPLPQGGRDGVTKNLILREDQIPQKLLYPKKKNKEKDYFSIDDIFSHGGHKKAPLKPPVGKAVAVFTGKRNPNDNHFSRKRV